MRESRESDVLVVGGGPALRALNELIPDWKERGAPLNTAATEDRVIFRNETGGRKVLSGQQPDCFMSHGNYIRRLGNVAEWLGEQAEALGVEVYPGFAGAEIFYDESGAVKGARPATWASPAKEKRHPFIMQISRAAGWSRTTGRPSRSTTSRSSASLKPRTGPHYDRCKIS